MRDPNKIYLSAIRQGNTFKIIDQDHREVANVTNLSVDADLGELVRFSASFIDAPVDSQDSAHVAGRGK